MYIINVSLVYIISVISVYNKCVCVCVPIVFVDHDSHVGQWQITDCNVSLCQSPMRFRQKIYNIFLDESLGQFADKNDCPNLGCKTICSIAQWDVLLLQSDKKKKKKK